MTSPGEKPPTPAQLADQLRRRPEQLVPIAELGDKAPLQQVIGRLLLLTPEQDEQLHEPFDRLGIRVLTWKPHVRYGSPDAFRGGMRHHDTTASDLFSETIRTLKQRQEMSGLTKRVNMDVENVYIRALKSRSDLYGAECQVTSNPIVGDERLLVRKFLQPHVAANPGPIQVEFGEIILENASLTLKSVKLDFTAAIAKALRGHVTLQAVELIDLPTSD